MTDEADEAALLIEKQEALALAKARKAVASMPEGTQGNCDLCGNWSGRLVEAVCAPCRDKYKLG